MQSNSSILGSKYCCFFTCNWLAYCIYFLGVVSHYLMRVRLQIGNLFEVQSVIIGTPWCHWVFRSGIAYCYDWTGSDRGDRNNLGGLKESYHVEFFRKTLVFDTILVHDITGTRLWIGYETSHKQFIAERKSYSAFVDVTALDDTQLQSIAQ